MSRHTLTVLPRSMYSNEKRRADFTHRCQTQASHPAQGKDPIRPYRSRHAHMRDAAGYLTADFPLWTDDAATRSTYPCHILRALMQVSAGVKTFRRIHRVMHRSLTPLLSGFNTGGTCPIWRLGLCPEIRSTSNTARVSAPFRKLWGGRRTADIVPDIWSATAT